MKNKNNQIVKPNQVIKYGKDFHDLGCVIISSYVPYENHGIKKRKRSKPYLEGFFENQTQVLN
jgi:hypothetical protein